MIKWTGTDTAKRVKWEAEAETYKELAEKLNDSDLIPSLYDEEGQAWLERWYTTSNPEEAYESMTEEDWATFIRDSNGMAYYQEFEVTV